MPVVNVVDAMITFRIIKMLVTSWTSTDAYKLGIIDKDGNPLKKVEELKTPEEEAAYTSLYRLVFKLKRILQKIPLVNRNLTNYAAALWLIKECNESMEEPDNVQELFILLNSSLDALARERAMLVRYMKEEPSLILHKALMNEEGAANVAGSGAVAGFQGDAGKSAVMTKKVIRRFNHARNGKSRKTSKARV